MLNLAKFQKEFDKSIDSSNRWKIYFRIKRVWNRNKLFRHHIFSMSKKRKDMSLPTTNGSSLNSQMLSIYYADRIFFAYWRMMCRPFHRGHWSSTKFEWQHKCLDEKVWLIFYEYLTLIDRNQLEKRTSNKLHTFLSKYFSLICDSSHRKSKG